MSARTKRFGRLLSRPHTRGVHQSAHVFEPNIHNFVAHSQRAVEPVLEIEDRCEVVVSARSLDVFGAHL